MQLNLVMTRPCLTHDDYGSGTCISFYQETGNELCRELSIWTFNLVAKLAQHVWLDSEMLQHERIKRQSFSILVTD